MDKRFALRRASANDAEALQAIRQQPEAKAIQPLRNYSLERLREILSIRSKSIVSPAFSGKMEWVMEQDDQVVGWITIDVTNRQDGIASIGYTVSSRHHGRGFATRAVQEVTTLAFDPREFGLHTLRANAATTNGASRRVLAKCGFIETGVTHGFLKIDGEPVDHVHGELRRDDWLANTSLRPASPEGVNMSG